LSRFDHAACGFLTGIFALAAPLILHAEPTTFASGGKRIRIEEFGAAKSGKQPAVIIVHGSTGLPYGDRFFAGVSETFASQGFATYLVHYFDSTGTNYASDADIRWNFATWLQTLDDATAHVSDRPGVDRRRIGFFGYSLGGYLAVARAADDPRIGAVVELAGGIDPGYARKVRRLPPLLILHGTRDQRVPPTEAEALEQLARRIGATSEKKLYDGEGHILSGGAFVDVFARGTAFFRKHLAR